MRSLLKVAERGNVLTREVYPSDGEELDKINKGRFIGSTLGGALGLAAGFTAAHRSKPGTRRYAPATLGGGIIGGYAGRYIGDKLSKNQIAKERAKKGKKKFPDEKREIMDHDHKPFRELPIEF